jgi:hypothetical protein
MSESATFSFSLVRGVAMSESRTSSSTLSFTTGTSREDSPTSCWRYVTWISDICKDGCRGGETPSSDVVLPQEVGLFERSRLAREELYDWYLSRGLSNQLLEVRDLDLRHRDTTH